MLNDTQSSEMMIHIKKQEILIKRIITLTKWFRSTNMWFMILYLICFAIISCIWSFFYTEDIIKRVEQGMIPELTIMIIIFTSIIFLPQKLIYFPLQKIIKINLYLAETNNAIDSIESILKKNQLLYKTLKELSILNTYVLNGVVINSRKWNTKVDRNIESEKETVAFDKLISKFYRYEFEFIISILTNLRSDLQIRLNEQKESLEWARSEVESNIKWSNNLEQVSEIQKIRLDRQIEQFEELQRVLN